MKVPELGRGPRRGHKNVRVSESLSQEGKKILHEKAWLC